MKTRNSTKKMTDLKELSQIPNEALEEEKEDTNIYKFHFCKKALTMQNNGQWELGIMVERIMKTIHKNYSVTLIVDLDPIEEKLELCRGRLDHNQTTLNGESEADMEYKQLMAAKDELIKNCPNIKFEATVLASRYIDLETNIALHIPPDVINKFNDLRSYLSNYKIKIEPFIS